MKKISIAVLGVIFLASCQTQQTLYSDSEDATYVYTKRTTDEALEKAMVQYQKVIARQNGLRKTVPPGVNAEYGYLLCKAGRKQEGLALLRAEVQAYPESEKFISRIINQLEK